MASVKHAVRGLRTLAPRHPDYQPRYDGDRRGRDGAYHQGSIWPWLLGHYLDAAIRVKGAMPAMESVLRGPLFERADAWLRPGAWPRPCVG
ncbi:MAG: hypothetical protein JXB05_22280 [Myxococcaceae bacterium]|nr:hypothetical protein [Myxococcaceae bacterium]